MSSYTSGLAPGALGRGLATVAIFFAGVLLASACSSTTDDSVRETPQSKDAELSTADNETQDGGEPEWTGAQLNPYDLRAGQCFSEWSWFDTQFDRRINITAAVECAEPHKREVYFEAEFPAPNGAPFPGETKMTEWSTDLCYNAFADFVGTEYELSIYGIDFIQPTRETFEHPVGRHRRVTCIIYNTDDEDLVESVRHTAI